MKEIACFGFTPDGRGLNIGDSGEKSNFAPDYIEISANNFDSRNIPLELAKKLDNKLKQRVTDYALNVKSKALESDRSNLE